eukprot:m.40850 g.40850  ORF g.40850 m.40850 type:complete len:485 (+) comp10404_c0_seq3:23-1477(+)
MASLIPSLSESQRKEVAVRACHFGAAHGIQLISKQDPHAFVLAPFSALSTPVPRAAFELGQALQPLFNKLVDRISRDPTFVEQALAKTAANDEFTGHLLEVYHASRGVSPSAHIRMGLIRNDFMLHETDGTVGIRQVEINTISASFAMLSARIAAMHTYLASQLTDPAPCIPASTAPTAIPALFHEAMTLFSRLYPLAPGAPPRVVVMAVQPGERNVLDQRHLEHELWSQHRVHTFRRTLLEIAQTFTLDAATGKLTFTDCGVTYEVAVIYFRSGYAPTDHPCKPCWDARVLVEKARAFKCPDILTHLVGTKKVQQVLSGPGVLERFVTPAEAARLRETFVGLYSLDVNEYATPEAFSAVLQRVRTHPEHYVLKPQREGGGNNIYGAAIVTALDSMSPTELTAHILMEKIQSTPIPALFLSPHGEPSVAPASVELGFYGTLLSTGDAVLVNASAGHMMRTKHANIDEAGVIAGFGCLDAPLLVD